jgi:hypothetical protein
MSLNSRLKDLLGPVTRVKKKKKKEQTNACEAELAHSRLPRH